MKLDQVVAAIVAGGLITADKAPDAVRLALAADKRAKDNTGLGPRNLQHAADKAMDEREAACDEREEAMDAAEAESDKDKTDDKAKDRKGARDKRAKDRMDRKTARDKRAKDTNLDPEGTNDGGELGNADPNPPGGPREKGSTAVDSATVTKMIADAVGARDALHAARADTSAILGVSAFDSAESTYRAALDKLGVDHKNVDGSALRTILQLAKDKSAASSPAAPAMDAATATGVAKVFPGLNRLRK